MCDQHSEDEILDYSRGDLPPQSAVRVAAHLPTCPDCQAVHRSVLALLELAAEPPSEPTARTDRRVHAEIARAARRVTVVRRANWRRAAAVAVAAGVVLAVGGWWLVRSDRDAVMLTAVSGEVVLRRGDREWRAEAGTPLRPRDTLSVPPGGSAVVALADATRAELGARTTVEMAPTTDGSLFLKEGFLDMEVAPRRADRALRVRTPGADAEVLGTRFSLSVVAGDTSLRVEEGRVHFTRAADRAGVFVSAGHRVSSVGAEAMAAIPARTGEVLVVVSHDEKMRASWDKFNRILEDRLVGERVQRLAYRVAIKNLAELTPADVAGRPLVVVSLADYNVGLETALAHVGLDTADVPVLCLEPVGYPALGMTGPVEGRDFGFQGQPSMLVHRPDHPLVGGAPVRDARIQLGKAKLGWGRPSDEAAIVLAVDGEPSRAVLFGYEAGSRMADRRRAPARRVGLFLDPADAGRPGAAGWNLFDAAVEWCTGRPGTGGSLKGSI